MRILKRWIVRLLGITHADIPPAAVDVSLGNLPNFLRRQAD